MENYRDMIYLSTPKSKNHPTMERKNRAVQFAPFAALEGYHEAIGEDSRSLEKRVDLDLEAREILDRKLAWIQGLPKEAWQISLVYFVEAPNGEGGLYKQAQGQLKEVGRGYLLLEGRGKIPIEDILEIDSPFLPEIEDP